uniref:Uncharacterized protein n=1 Tax=Anguilla anguilla TaxID=7936 RepID=A0A0E9WQB9_ANGAN
MRFIVFNPTKQAIVFQVWILSQIWTREATIFFLFAHSIFPTENAVVVCSRCVDQFIL